MKPRSISKSSGAPSARARLRFLALVASGFSLASSAAAAPCCSSNAAAPSILSGDDRAQLTSTFSRGTVIGDAPASGLPVFRDDGLSEVTEVFRVDGAMLLSDRIQIGGGIPIVSRSLSNAGSDSRSTQVGDVRLSGAYEFLPEWSYSSWRPKGFAFLQATIPTAKSIYDARESDAVDAAGKGFYSLALGALLTKKWAVWDAYAIPEAHYSFRRTFSDAADGTGPLTVSPGFGGSLALGAGYSPGGGDFRFGFRVQPTFDQAKSIRSESGTTRADSQRSWDTSLEAAYLVQDNATILASYSDQTLLGPAKNTTLSRTFAVGYQHRWER